MGKMRGTKMLLVAKPDKNKQLGRPRLRWEGYIKIDLQEVKGGAWTDLLWLRIRTGGGLL